MTAERGWRLRGGGDGGRVNGRLRPLQVLRFQDPPDFRAVELRLDPRFVFGDRRRHSPEVRVNGRLVVGRGRGPERRTCSSRSGRAGDDGGRASRRLLLRRFPLARGRRGEEHAHHVRRRFRGLRGLLLLFRGVRLVRSEVPDVRQVGVNLRRIHRIRLAQRVVSGRRRPVVFELHFVDLSTLSGTVTDGETGNRDHCDPQFNCTETRGVRRFDFY